MRHLACEGVNEASSNIIIRCELGHTMRYHELQRAEDFQFTQVYPVIQSKETYNHKKTLRSWINILSYIYIYILYIYHSQNNFIYYVL